MYKSNNKELSKEFHPIFITSRKNVYEIEKKIISVIMLPLLVMLKESKQIKQNKDEFWAWVFPCRSQYCNWEEISTWIPYIIQDFWFSLCKKKFCWKQVKLSIRHNMLTFVLVSCPTISIYSIKSLSVLVLHFMSKNWTNRKQASWKRKITIKATTTTKIT